MRVLAILIGAAIAALIVTALAVAAPDQGAEPASVLGPSQQAAVSEAPPPGLYIVVAAAGLTTLIVLAPAAGRF